MVEGKNFTVCDNISANQVIGTLSASVPEGQDLTYRLTEDADGLFEIDGDGKISLASGKDLSFTNTNRHVITVEVSNTVSSDTSTADVTIDVGTVPLVAKANYVFTYGNDVSVMLNNLGQSVESFTHSSNFPMGLDFASQNGQLSIQGSPRAVTLDESNQLAAVPIDAVLHNSCGSNSFRATITVHPIYVSDDQSPNIVAETNAAASSNNSNYIGQLHRADAISFASGGTGAYNDPVIIGVGTNANSFSMAVDYNNVEVPVSNFDTISNDMGQKEFHILLIGKGDLINRKVQSELIRDDGTPTFIELTLYNAKGTVFSEEVIFFYDSPPYSVITIENASFPLLIRTIKDNGEKNLQRALRFTFEF